MKRFVPSVLLVFAFLLTGIALPKILFKHAINTEETIARAKDSTYPYIFDNSIKPWLIRNLVVRNKKSNGVQEIAFLDAYTLFKIKYATVASIYSSQTGALVCAGQTYQL